MENHASEFVQVSESSSETPSLVNARNRNNNFNFLRLLLATFVLIQHSVELVDGNKHREILTRIFGTISLGEVAVDGFFLLSGYLVLQSWQRNTNVANFLKKRVLRIYPAFIVASLISALVVGPLGSTPTQYFAALDLPQLLKSTALLQAPAVPPVFEGQLYPTINASMWTIPYEFRCYLMIPLLGLCGLFGHRWWLPVLTVSAIFLSLASPIVSQVSFRGAAMLLGDPATMMHLIAFFCSGGCFYLFRDRIRFQKSWLFLSFLVWFLCMFRLETAQFASVTFGAYLLFGLAQAPIAFLERFKKSADISYGLYLYGWPVQKLLLWYIPSLSTWLLFLLALGISGVCGFLSWHLVEHPFLRLIRKEEKTKFTNALSGA